MSYNNDYSMWFVVGIILILVGLFTLMFFEFDATLYTNAPLAANATSDIANWAGTPAKDLTVRGLMLAIMISELFVMFVKNIFD